MLSPRSIARLLVPACALGTAALLSACSDSNGPGSASGNNLSVAVATVSAAPAGQKVGSSAPGVSLDRHVTSPTGTHTIIITRAAVVLSRLELASVDSAGCAADDHPEVDDDRCHHLETGPLLVELPTDNSVVSMLSLQLPVGIYHALEAKIRAVRSQDDGGSAFLSAHPEFAQASVRVEGTFDGASFVYTGDANSSLELTFDPPLTVVSAATTLTVHVSIDRWFADRDGNLVDPRTANAGGANEQLVNDNVRRSFHAFEDHDRRGDDGHNDDGFDDHGNDGGNHDGGDDHGGDGSVVH
ncbi:MAG: hypothetical protein M3Y30_16230 [Gemmatimonadota bacterium]|nr:hypothetical protein [Gemmatimonadota bacterium]